jgi:uncharacterized repeat protein (TIGR03803 family)
MIKLVQKIIIILCVFSLIALTPYFNIAYAANISLLREFTGGVNDGSYPYYDSLVISGNTIYGMTRNGGASNSGTIFSINTNGTNYTLLHSFAGGGTDGAYPQGSLILSGSTLYGMTYEGGDSNRGTIFSIGTDGNNFTLLREFAGGGADGASPQGSLILSGSTLFGMTSLGGDSNLGTVFSIATDGNNFTLLREFAGGGADGASPQGSLILSGSTLFGMTSEGGDSTTGTVFSIGTDGNNFTLLREFAGGGTDGASPYGSLILSSSTLFGMTSEGGDSGSGTIFSIGTDGNNFTLLREFAGGASDGASPYGSLILSSGTLYGLTNEGGDSGNGTVFSIGTGGNNFTLLYELAGGASDGAYPYGSLILSSNKLFGMTNEGGDNNRGIIFSLEIDVASEPTPTNSSLSSSLTTPLAPSCTTSKPNGIPDLFQIDVGNSQATLYFTPLSNSDKYFIAFGTDSFAENHGVEFAYSDTSGVVAYTINHLSPNTTFYLKVRGGNGCMPGNWSNSIEIKTRGNNITDGITYYKNFASKILPVFPAM